MSKRSISGKARSFLSHARVNEREITIHDRAIESVFRFGFKFGRAPALGDRIVFAAHKSIKQSQIRTPLRAPGRLPDGALPTRSCQLKFALRFLDIAARQENTAFQKTDRRGTPVIIRNLSS